MCLNVVIAKKTFEIELDLYFRSDISERGVIEVCDSDTIAEVKMKVIEKYHPAGLEQIETKLNDQNSVLSTTSRKAPKDFFNFGYHNTVLENYKTVEECKISPNSFGFKIDETLLVRIHLDSLEIEETLLEYSVPKHNCIHHIYDVLENFREQHRVHRKELHVMPDQEGVTIDLFDSWRIETLDGDVYVIDYIVLKRSKLRCHIM